METPNLTLKYSELRGDAAEAKMRCESFTAYLVARMHDPSLRCSFDPMLKGGRYIIEHLVMETYDHERAAKAPSYKPKNGWNRVLIVEDPDGNFTRPDSFVAKQMEQNRDITRAWLTGDKAEAEKFVYSHDG